tara:strand:- start:981 stop:1478 length:498 start_codon:yes stop_codon:yes gene_type:complete
VLEGLKTTRPEIQVHFTSEAEKEKKEYKDTFTDALPTEDDIRKKYGAIVWCKYTGCTYNQEVEGLQRTSGTILKNKTYQPIAEQEAIWTSLCTRGEIAIKFDEVQSGLHAKVKVPSCFSSATKGKGHVDFTNFLNSDGSAIGGNIDSQHVSDAGYDALESNSIYK